MINASKLQDDGGGPEGTNKGIIIFESSGGGLGPKELIRLDGSNSLSVKILHPPQRTSDGIDLPPGGMISGDEVLLLGR